MNHCEKRDKWGPTDDALPGTGVASFFMHPTRGVRASEDPGEKGTLKGAAEGG